MTKRIPRFRYSKPGEKRRRNMKLKSYKVVDVSCGHISKDDGRLLQEAEACSNGPVMVISYPEGFFIWVGGRAGKTSPTIRAPRAKPRTERELLNSGFSQEFVNIMLAADKSGAEYINIHSYGTEYKGLPNFP
jgi:hypothetical protein